MFLFWISKGSDKRALALIFFNIRSSYLGRHKTGTSDKWSSIVLRGMCKVHPEMDTEVTWINTSRQQTWAPDSGQMK